MIRLLKVYTEIRVLSLKVYTEIRVLFSRLDCRMWKLWGRIISTAHMKTFDKVKIFYDFINYGYEIEEMFPGYL